LTLSIGGAALGTAAWMGELVKAEASSRHSSRSGDDD
jgi:hypothetical protein